MDSKAEKVLGMMEKMKLLDTKRKSIELSGAVAGSKPKSGPQAVGKVLAEKPIRAESLELSLGRQTEGWPSSDGESLGGEARVIGTLPRTDLVPDPWCGVQRFRGEQVPVHLPA